MFKNVIYVMFSNVITLLSSVFIGLIIPKLMGVDDYGYYKMFILYGTYTALLHFGFNDGMLIRYGGKDFKAINKKEFRMNTEAYIVLEFFLSILLCSLSFIFHNQYRYIFSMLGIYSSVYNLTTYYQFFSQAIENFVQLSNVKILQSIINILNVGVLFFLFKIKIIKSISYQLYIAMVVATYATTMAWYIYSYRNVTFGPKYRFDKGWLVKWKELFKIGFPITIAYQVSALVLNLDNQYISIFFSSRVFGIYSFAYSLISMVSTVMSAISTVMFPHLNKQNRDEVLNKHDINLSYVLIVIYMSLVVYYPLRVFIQNYLSEYSASLIYFRILFPIVGITSAISLVNFNYFKVFGKGNIYFLISCFILVLAMISNGIAYYLFKSPIAIAVSTLIVTFIWYLITEFYFVVKYQIKWIRNAIYLSINILNFEILSNIKNTLLGAILYLLIYIIITVIMYRKSKLRHIKI